MALANSPTVEFYQAGTVREVTVYAIVQDRDAILIYTPEENLTVGTYHYVPYCPTHKVAWSSRDFTACPKCQPNGNVKGGN